MESTRRNLGILWVGANPLSSDRLALDVEMRAIQQSIRMADFREEVALEAAWAARPQDLLQRINEVCPSIVHFSGHANSAGLLLHDENDGENLVAQEAILRVLCSIQPPVQMLVVNACDTFSLAKNALSAVPITIGMTRPISDAGAAIFASRFYSGLTFGHSVDLAFRQATAELSLRSPADYGAPELLAVERADPRRTWFTGPLAREHIGAASHSLGLMASRVAELFVLNSQNGDDLDPAFKWSWVKEQLSTNDDDLEEAMKELESLGWAQTHEASGSKDISPLLQLFVNCDSSWQSWSPREDGASIADSVIASPDQTLNVPQCAATRGWGPRRMNPAVGWLEANDLIAIGKGDGIFPWTAWWLRATSATRRWRKKFQES